LVSIFRMRVVSETAKITRSTIDAAGRRKAPGQRIIIRDTLRPGLALIVGSKRMTWVFFYRPRGVDSRTGKRWLNQGIPLGIPEELSIDDARLAANDLNGEAKRGGDPAAARKSQMAANNERRSNTVDRLIEDYIKELPARAKLRGKGRISEGHAREEASHVRAAVGAMQAGSKPIGGVDASDLRKLLRADPEHPNAARHRFGAINRFFDWCLDDRLITVNPCSTIAKRSRPRAPDSRADYLKLDELAQLWHAAGSAEDLANVHVDFVRFLITIPCRRGEAAQMEWQNVDLGAAIWSQPAHMTKNKEPHRLHLHPLARDILHARHEAAGRPRTGLVFPAPRSGKAIDTFTDIKAGLVKTAPDLPEWRFHDTRRSFVSSLAKAAIPEVVADAILNHRQAGTRAGVLGTYQRETHWDEQIRATQLWGRLLSAAIMGSDTDSDVVSLQNPGESDRERGIGAVGGIG
jgi:integrase